MMRVRKRERKSVCEIQKNEIDYREFDLKLIFRITPRDFELANQIGNRFDQQEKNQKRYVCLPHQCDKPKFKCPRSTDKIKLKYSPI